jgi:hypothetical protein
MAAYRLAGQDLYFSNPLPELEPFEINNEMADTVPFVHHSFHENELISRSKGWVGGAQRSVAVYAASRKLFLKVEGGSEIFIASHGEAIGKQNPQEAPSQLDREIILGPALVLALALRDTWSLHASAALCHETTIVFLGESGRGKSTLAAYLSSTENPDWHLVADDILPVTISFTGVDVWPRFPQLKLPMQAQPGLSLPEHLPLNALCILTSAGQEEIPELQCLPPNLAARELISHTAGTRMFTPELLGKHLAFCTQVAGQVPVYRLTYPHRRDALPKIKTLLENIC